MSHAELVGITSSVPIEVIYAAGLGVVDLNNVFIESKDASSLVEQAERRGFPESSCAWIKGIYTAIRRSDIRTVIAVVQGDCSNTHALMETLEFEGIRTIPFLYPYDRDRDLLRLQIDKLCSEFGIDIDKAIETKRKLDVIRAKVRRIDDLTWQDGKVTGFENHYFQISCSDMRSNPDLFEKEVDDFLKEVKDRSRRAFDIRLGYIGIPPIVSGLYEFVELQGATIVYNELQRQFSMPLETEDLLEQYRAYTYPYHIKYRLEDIKRQVALRRIDGIIHYVQAFCFRQIEDIIIRKTLNIPVLTIEGNRPAKLDLKTQMRLEAFLDIVRSRKARGLTG